MENAWREDVPGFEGDGQRIIMVDALGFEREGLLVWYDNSPGPDEAPLFRCVAPDGCELDFYGAQRWRYLCNK